MTEHHFNNTKDWSKSIIESYLQSKKPLIRADLPKSLMLGFQIGNHYYYLKLAIARKVHKEERDYYELLINLWAKTNGLNTSDFAKSDYYNTISMSDEEFEKQLRIFELISIVEK